MVEDSRWRWWRRCDKGKGQASSWAHHVVQVTGHIGECEPRIAVDADFRGIAVLAHADGARVVNGVVRDLPRGALRADDACACKSRLSTLAGFAVSTPLQLGWSRARTRGIGAATQLRSVCGRD